MSTLCADCGARAEWLLSSRRDAVVQPPDVVQVGACRDHRLDTTEDLLSRYGNVTVEETLG